MRISIPVASFVVLAALSSNLAEGALIYDSGVTTVTANASTQLGRISRNGIISDWSSVKAFPGEVNPTIAYRYTTYSIPILAFPYLQVTFDDLSGVASTFVAAYLNSYNPSDKASTYLGDPGSSGNYFGVDPLAFQVTVNPGNALVVAVNDTSTTGAGVGKTYRILVEGFSDSNFGETPIPEPAVWTLTLGGLLALFIYRLRSKKAGLCN